VGRSAASNTRGGIRLSHPKYDVDEPLIATPGFNAGAMVDRVLSDLGRYGGRLVLVLVLDDVHELAPTVQPHLTRTQHLRRARCARSLDRG
jgi:hypothetical protein